MEAQESLPGPQLQGLSGGRRTWDPNKKMQKGVISSELPRETATDLLGICQQVPQISTSVAEEDVLLRGWSPRDQCAASGKQHDCLTNAV